jgi:hypothetical protein
LALDHDWTEHRSLAVFGPSSQSSVGILAARAAATTHRISCGSTYASCHSSSTNSLQELAARQPSAQGRFTQILDSIAEHSERSTSEVSVDTSRVLRQTESFTSAKNGSRHDGVDYLRPMREQRELENLCGPGCISTCLRWDRSGHCAHQRC